jgi:hypothetical protein
MNIATQGVCGEGYVYSTGTSPTVSGPMKLCAKVPRGQGALRCGRDKRRLFIPLNQYWLHLVEERGPPRSPATSKVPMSIELCAWRRTEYLASFLVHSRKIRSFGFHSELLTTSQPTIIDKQAVLQGHPFVEDSRAGFLRNFSNDGHHFEYVLVLAHYPASHLHYPSRLGPVLWHQRATNRCCFRLPTYFNAT